MKTIMIKRLSDSNSCETCGGGWADGAEVTFPNGDKLLLEPVADCFGGDNYEDDIVLMQILEKLGYKIEWM